jgi:hypothetical protein
MQFAFGRVVPVVPFVPVKGGVVARVERHAEPLPSRLVAKRSSITFFSPRFGFRPSSRRAKRYRTQSFAQAAPKSGKMRGGLFHFGGRVARITM